jgi:hypothetical protein
VAEERGRVQHRRPLPGAGAVGPRAELLGEDFGAPGQVSARGRAQCSEPGTCCHLFGWGASCIRAWVRSSLRVKSSVIEADFVLSSRFMMFRAWRGALSDSAPEQLWR